MIPPVVELSSTTSLAVNKINNRHLHYQSHKSPLLNLIKLKLAIPLILLISKLHKNKQINCDSINIEQIINMPLRSNHQLTNYMAKAEFLFIMEPINKLVDCPLRLSLW